MRHLFFIATLCMIAQQSVAQDKIVKLNGKTINGKVTEIAVSTIKYKVDGEDFIRNVISSEVQEIIFKSGKVESLNKRISIFGESDWAKVQVLNFESEIDGLVKGEEIKAIVHGSLSTTTKSKINNKALQKIKRIAASKGYHAIVILNEERKGAHSGKSRGGLKASITALGYSY